MGRVPKEVGRHGVTFYLDQEMIRILQNHWSKVLTIIKSDSHFLRLPAMRLIDGGCRSRPVDAIIDYSIGLESLLSEMKEKEISKNFSLRGAKILSWDGGNETNFCNNLRDIYDWRSAIVHGDIERIKKLTHNDKKLTLDRARSFSEEYLRKIWWWFLKDFRSIREGIKIVDDRIMQ